MSDLPVELVVAVADNGVIGADGDMPWRLPSDLARFKAHTLGNPVIMGRRTHESIGRPLPGRLNVVVTRRSDYRPDGCVVAGSIDEALAIARRHAGEGARAISVIGGAEIYAQIMVHADRLVVTHVRARPDGDTRLPPIDGTVWRAGEPERVSAHPDDTEPIEVVVYERR